MTNDQPTGDKTTERDWFFDPIRRLNFENGWTIDVHREKDGETWYRRWAPGVENQSMFAELYRQSSEWFREQIAKVPYTEASRG